MKQTAGNGVIRLTPKGREALKEAGEHHRELVTDLFFNALSLHDLKGMSTALAHLADHLQ